MVLWEKSRDKEKEILADLQNSLEILETYDVAWTPDRVAENFSRFYGVKLGSRSAKERECGRGRFLLIILWDPEPSYVFTLTSRGHEIVNKKLFGLKDKYRSWTGGGSKVHATNSPEETNHDITLLLGKNYEDYLKTPRKKWDGTHIKRDCDLPGCHGWENLQQLFYVLNNTINYLVLRNHECLPTAFTTEEHGDIDLLAEHQGNMELLLNASLVYPKLSYRVHYRNKVGGEWVYWDIRSLGDSYYCDEWEENMLAERVLNEHGIYIQSPENYFYSLVYHAAIHKFKVASDYYPRMQKLYDALPDVPRVNVADYPSNLDAFYGLLKKYMREKSYTFTQPVDKSVYYNKQIIGSKTVLAFLNKLGYFKNAELVRINMAQNPKQAEIRVFARAQFNGKPVFIKLGSPADVCCNEYKQAKDLYDVCPDYVCAPIAYKGVDSNSFIAYEYLNATSLADMMVDGLTPEQKKNFISQLAKLADALLAAGVVHRDVRPENFVVTEDGTLKLHDFEYAVSAKRYREVRSIRKKTADLRWLGGTYRPKTLIWDDMYAIAKIMEELGATELKSEELKHVRSLIGSCRIVCKKRALILFYSRLAKMLSRVTPVKRWRRALRKL